MQPLYMSGRCQYKFFAPGRRRVWCSRLLKPNEPQECREQLFRQTCQSALMQPIVAIELFQTLRPFVRSHE